jgi:hypothetical protein
MKKSIFPLIIVCALMCFVDNQSLEAQDSYSTKSSDRVSPPTMDAFLKDLCNQVMFAIYQDITTFKEEYMELEDFGPYVLSENQYGIYSLEYEYIVSEGFQKGERIAFGVTIVRLDDTNFNQYGNQAFAFGFPLLDLKFSGYQQESRRQEAFDIQKVIQKNGNLLLAEQNKHLPLKLTLETVKENYHVGEDIEIIVILQNVSSKNFWVKELSEDTLFFIYGDTHWGTRKIGPKKQQKIKRQILKQGQRISERFVGSGFLEPQEIEIFGSYVVTFKGVNPSSFLKIIITKE